MRIHNAGNGVQFMRDLLRERIGLVALWPGNPDVDRRRLTEIQHLIDDIGGLEEKLQFRKALGQFAAQIGDMGRRRRMLLLQRDQNFAVHRTDGGRVAQRDIDAAIGQADVVEDDVDLILADDLADRAFDFGEIALGLLKPGGGRRTNMQAHLAGIHLREKISPEPREQQQRASHQQNEENAGDGRPPDAKRDDVAIAFAEAVEAVLESVMDQTENIEPRAWRDASCAGVPRMTLERRAHEIGEQHRHQREGQRKAGDQRNADRQRQRREQIFGRALQQKHRHEHDADAQRRKRGRNRDFAAALTRWPPAAIRLLCTWRSIFSITTVLLSTRMPTASAKPPSVIVFNVWPPTYMTRMAAMIDSGIVARMISVSRQLPRNSRIIIAVSPAAITPPISTLFSEALTKTD